MMDEKWILATEEQKKRICEKQREELRAKAVATAISAIISGVVFLLLIMFCHGQEINSAEYDLLGYYPYNPPEIDSFYDNDYYWENDQERQEILEAISQYAQENDWNEYDLLGYIAENFPEADSFYDNDYRRENDQELREILEAEQQEKIAQAAAAVKPQIFRQFLPFYVLWFLVIAGIIGGCILFCYLSGKTFEKNLLYYRKMRVIGKESYRTRHYSSKKLTLKDEDGTVMKEVRSDCFYEIEPDTEVIMVRTDNTYDEYEAVYPAEILEGTAGF